VKRRNAQDVRQALVRLAWRLWESKRHDKQRHMKRETVRGEAKLLSGEEQRRRLIEERPPALGVTWANDSCADVTRSGRRVEGGWPGTVPEARMRVLSGLTHELAARGLAPLSQTELSTATSTVYDRARREWQLAGKTRPGKLSAAAGARAGK
jgi:hypothetical protein